MGAYWSEGIIQDLPSDSLRALFHIFKMFVKLFLKYSYFSMSYVFERCRFI